MSEEPAYRLAGLNSLTSPKPDKGIAGVVDVIVVGAVEDGKTQFITQAIDAVHGRLPRGQGGLSMDEIEYNLFIHRTARRTLVNPRATERGKVRHYVAWASLPKLMSRLGLGDKLTVLRGRRLLWRCAFACFLYLLTVVGVYVALVYGFGRDGRMGELGTGAAAFVGLLWTLYFTRRHVRKDITERAKQVEFVFWDVAGEDIVSRDEATGTSSPFFLFVEDLVAARSRYITKHFEYGLAIVLVCNPLTLGTDAEDSLYARTQRMMTEIHKLSLQPEVLVVVNRYGLVQGMCKPGANNKKNQLVAILDQRIVDHGQPKTTPASLLRRSVVHETCNLGDKRVVDGVTFRQIRYDAAGKHEYHEEPWPGWDQLEQPERFAHLSKDADIQRIGHYSYRETTAGLTGRPGARLRSWLIKQLWSKASQAVIEPPEGAEHAQARELEQLRSLAASKRRPAQRPGFHAGD